MFEKERILNIINDHLEDDGFQSYMFYIREVVESGELSDDCVPKQVKAFALDLLCVSKYLKKEVLLNHN